MRLIIIIFSIFLFNYSYAMVPFSVCGSIDRRMPSNYLKVGRLTGKMGGDYNCTGTLISNNCMVTAAHCLSYIRYIEFNTPEISPNGRVINSSPEDTYLADESSIVHGRNNYLGNDWAVFKVLSNEITGKLPGENQGYYPISFDDIFIGDIISITGYGNDMRLNRHRTQQSSSGIVTEIKKDNSLRYEVDTENGNSGSALILNGKIIGIHNQGGCSPTSVYGNKGTMILNNIKFINAINDCLK